MIVIQEFEFYPDPEGGYVVKPCGLDGATEGDAYEDAVEMAVDWLRVRALAELERGADGVQGRRPRPCAVSRRGCRHPGGERRTFRHSSRDCH